MEPQASASVVGDAGQPGDSGHDQRMKTRSPNPGGLQSQINSKVEDAQLAGSGEANLQQISNKTVFQMDYNHRQEVLAVCGNFGDIRLIKGDLQSLVDRSYKIKENQDQLAT